MALLLLSAVTVIGGCADSSPSSPSAERTVSNVGRGTYVVQGTVRAAPVSSGVAIAGATVTIVDGQNTGVSGMTDAAGHYMLTGVINEEFFISATKSDFEPEVRRINVVGSPTTVDFALNPPLRTIDDRFTDSISSTSARCNDYFGSLPCYIVRFEVHHLGVINARMTWTPASPDLDLTLWQDGSLVAAGVGVTQPETVTGLAIAGSAYELHVTYFGGNAPANFVLDVSHPN